MSISNCFQRVLIRFTKTISTGFCILLISSTANAVVTPEAKISYPTYSILHDSIFSLIPSVGKKRDEAMMQLLCQIARQEIDRLQSNQLLIEKGYDIDVIPDTGHSISLWINNDLAAQKAACAAYIATSLFLPQDNKEFLAKPDDPKSIEIDKDKFAEVMRVRFAIAEANAEVFSLILNNFDNSNTIEEYQKQFEKIFTDLAPLYLERIRNLYAAKEGTMTLLNLEGANYSVIDNEGRQLSYLDGQLTYKVRGIDWLANGKVLGHDSFVDVYYFSQENETLNEDNNEKPQNKKSSKETNIKKR